MAIVNSTWVLTARLDKYAQFMFHYDHSYLEEALEEFWHSDYPEVLADLDNSDQFPIDVIAIPDAAVQSERPFRITFNTAVFHAYFDHGHKADGPYEWDEFRKDIERKEPMKNDVTSFMFYMWNAWSEDECKEVFRDDYYSHFWNKWCECCEKSTRGAAERFYAELSEDNRNKLVKRALEVYEGKHDKRY